MSFYRKFGRSPVSCCCSPFELPWVLLNNSPGPDNRGLTIVMYLYQTGFLTGDLGYASAIGWILGLILAIAALVQLRWTRKEGH